MKKTYTSFILTALLISFSAALLAQPNTWNGGPTDGIDDGADWQTGLPNSAGNVGVISTDAFWTDTTPGSGDNFTLTNYFLDLQGGTLSNGGVANLYTFDGGTVSLNGGNISSGDSVRFDGGSTLTVNSGTLGTSAENLDIFDASATFTSGVLNTTTVQLFQSSSVFTFNGGTINATGTLYFEGGGGGFKGNASFNGGTSTFGGNLRFGDDGLLTMGGTSSGSLSFGGLTDEDNSANLIDWTSGSLMSLTITGYDSTQYESLWSSGKLTLDGGNTGTFSENFNVSGETLTLIPEPSSLALLALAGLAALFLRRRQ